MDDTICRTFFTQPSTALHRRFEALRAFFLDHRPLTEIAAQFGYRHGTLRNLVAQFRAQCRAGRIPPFSMSRLTDVPHDQHPVALPQNPSPKPRPIAISSLSRQDDVSAHGWPEFFSSCRSWPNFGSMTWWLKRVILARAWSPHRRRCSVC